MHKSLSAIARGRVDPDPGSTPIVVVKVTPVVPFPHLGFVPHPPIPGLDGPLIHIVHIVAIFEGGKFRSRTKESLAQFITNLVSSDI